jgi:hypothetical protein
MSECFMFKKAFYYLILDIYITLVLLYLGAGRLNLLTILIKES